MCLGKFDVKIENMQMIDQWLAMTRDADSINDCVWKSPPGSDVVTMKTKCLGK